MKVLFVITNINGFHEIPYSFGLSSLASYIESRGHEYDMLDIRSPAGYPGFLEQVSKQNFDVVAFTSVSSQFAYVSELASLLRERHPDLMLVCGGVHTTIFPESILESPGLDCVFVGESEYPFADFLDALSTGADWRLTKNIAYEREGKVVMNELYPLIQDVGCLPFPAKGPLFKEIVDATGVAKFFFSRGCPYQCTYCSNHAIAARYGRKANTPRYRSVDSCIEEILETKRKFGFPKLLVGDDTFGIDKKWRKDFLEKYKRLIDLPFHCLLRANIVDEELIVQLKEAGCYRITFGVESGNDYIRNTVMRRNISEDQMITAFSLCRKHGIESIALNIIGVPGETEEMIRDTVNLNRKLKATGSGVNIFYPYKGTNLGDYCFAQGLVDEEMYYDFSNERRDSVLRFDAAYKKRLKYYQDNWSILVDPWNIKKRALHVLYGNKILHGLARWTKRGICRLLGRG